MPEAGKRRLRLLDGGDDFLTFFLLNIKIKCEVSFSDSELEGKAFVEKCFKKRDN